MASTTGQDHADAMADASFSLRATVALSLIAFLVFGIGGWAATSTLAGAVITSGQVVVDNAVKKVQHSTGGVVGAIHVKVGDRVVSGDILVHLDDTQMRANLGIISSELQELTGRKARLAAERDGARRIVFPDGFEARGPEALHTAAGERQLFEVRAQSLAQQKAQLAERIGQYRSEIVGLKRQERAKANEIKLIEEELGRVTDMFKRQLTPITRVLAMQRDASRIGGEHGKLLADIARSEGSISETELRIIELDATRRADAQKELREIELRMGELNERRNAAEDALRRVDIRAPASGVVHELNANTVGGVIGPGETIMGIVPLEEPKVIEVRVAPTDVDQVWVGQKAILRFPGFNQRTTPELHGSVSVLASDVTREQQTGVSYYSARIQVDAADLDTLKRLKLVAGMPVEGYIQTTERTALSFLVKPFADQLAKAFREE